MGVIGKLRLTAVDRRVETGFQDRELTVTPCVRQKRRKKPTKSPFFSLITVMDGVTLVAEESCRSVDAWKTCFAVVAQK